MAGVHGARAQIGLGSADPVTELFELASGDLALTEEFFETSGLMGSRGHKSERVRRSTRRVSGSLTFQPNALELSRLVPRLHGAAASGTTFPLGESLTAFYGAIDYVQKVVTYSGLVAGRGTYRATQGGPLEMQLDIEGIDASIAASGTFPSLTLDTTTGGPFLFSDAVISVDGANYSFREMEVVLDNVLDTERFFNSNTRASIPAKDRIVSWRLSAPYGDASALYGLAITGVQCVATFTNGNMSVVMTSPKVSFPRQTPALSGKEEIMLPLMGIARKSGSGDELTLTIDSSP